MNWSAEWAIDPTNPGEVLACCGIAHLAWRADPDAISGFDHEVFEVKAGRDAFAPLDRLDLVPGDGAITLSGILLDWWSEWGLNPSFKTWAGQQTELTVHASLAAATGGSEVTEWLDVTAPAKGRLNVDVLGHWTSLGVGWSINEHNHVQMLCRPWVEVLASIGLQAFPVPGSRAEGYRYRLWRPASLATAIAGFCGHGPGVYGGPLFEARTGKAGSNTILLRAHRI